MFLFEVLPKNEQIVPFYQQIILLAVEYTHSSQNFPSLIFLVHHYYSTKTFFSDIFQQIWDCSKRNNEKSWWRAVDKFDDFLFSKFQKPNNMNNFYFLHKEESSSLNYFYFFSSCFLRNFDSMFSF